MDVLTIEERSGRSAAELHQGQAEAGPSHPGFAQPSRQRSAQGRARPRSAAATEAAAQVVDLTADTASHDDDDVVVVGIKPGLRPLRSLIKRTRPAAPPGQQPMHTAQHGQQAPQAHALPAGAWPAWLPPVAAQPVAPTRPSSPDSRKCAICLEKMEQMASTPCGHVFCHQCLLDCIKASKKCPKCRKPCSMKQVHRIYLD